MLHLLPKIQAKSKKRRGQGWGSGKGKYSARGVKGQKARTKTRALFEGGQLVLQKKLPMLRGKLKNKTVRPQAIVVSLKALEESAVVKTGMIITKESLVKIGLISKKQLKQGGPVKILSQGTLTKKLTVKVAASATAVKKITSNGGEYQP